jgi:hypothetical protein
MNWKEARFMGRSNENVISQLRQLNIQELQMRRELLLRNLRRLKWTIRLFGIVAIASIVSSFFMRDQAGLGIVLAVGAIFLVAFLGSKTKLWFIDLVLSEKTPSSDHPAGGGVKQ